MREKYLPEQIRRIEAELALHESELELLRQFWFTFGKRNENKGNPDDRHAYGEMPGARSC